jgi:hypothetical protein
MSTDPTLGESLRLLRIASVSSTLAKGLRSIQRKKLPPPSMSWQSERHLLDLYQRDGRLFLHPKPELVSLCRCLAKRQPSGYVELSYRYRCSSSLPS